MFPGLFAVASYTVCKAAPGVIVHVSLQTNKMMCVLFQLINNTFFTNSPKSVFTSIVAADCDFHPHSESVDPIKFLLGDLQQTVQSPTKLFPKGTKRLCLDAMRRTDCVWR